MMFFMQFALRSAHGLSMIHQYKETTAMNWEGPSFTEIKMDSEINSYQDDFRDGPDANEPSNATPIITTRQE